MKSKKIELVCVKETKHKTITTVQGEEVTILSADFVMPKEYGNSIKAKVTVNYKIIEGYEIPSKVYLVMDKARKLRK